MHFCRPSQQFQRREQAYQAEAMVAVKVRDENVVHACEAHMIPAHLHLGAFAAVNQEQLVAEINDLRAWYGYFEFLHTAKVQKPNVAGSSGLYIFNTFQRFLSRKILRSESLVNTRFLTPKKRSDIFRNTSDIFQNTRHIFFIFCGRRFSVPENKRAKTEVNVK